MVEYIDLHFRTIPDRESRGITGISMGGHGAIKTGMIFPDVFSSVYAMSPAILGLAKEFGPNSLAYKKAPGIKSFEDLYNGNFYEQVVIALGRAYSPNPNHPPFFTDLPFTYVNDSLIVNYKVLKLWNKNSPIEMADVYASNLNKLKALKLDWGRNDEGLHIPLTCMIFSQKLENLGINHFAEEYIGKHTDKIWTIDGRFLTEVLPFFDYYLSFKY